jgi:phosphotransferase system HPr (HPr) family protein
MMPAAKLRHMHSRDSENDMSNSPVQPGSAALGPQNAPVSSGAEAAGGRSEPLRRTVTITNPQGFHLRPVSSFAQRAAQFDSSVWLSKGGQRVNGKSALELLFLAAEQGTEVTLEVSGRDAPEAMEALAHILAAPTPEAAEAPPPAKG